MNAVPVANGSRPRRLILVVGADAALAGLLAEWLAEHGEVVAQHIAEAEAPSLRADLVVVDVAFPRLLAGEGRGLARLAAAHAGTPLIALSPTFFPGIARHGEVARRLGVAAVLPKPVPRQALLDAVRLLLPAA